MFINNMLLKCVKKTSDNYKTLPLALFLTHI